MNYATLISLLSTSLESLPHKLLVSGKMQGDKCLSLDLLKLNLQLLPPWNLFLPSLLQFFWVGRSLCPFLRHGTEDHITFSLLATREMDMDSTPIRCLHCSCCAMVIFKIESEGTILPIWRLYQASSKSQLIYSFLCLCTRVSVHSVNENIVRRNNKKGEYSRLCPFVGWCSLVQFHILKAYMLCFTFN